MKLIEVIVVAVGIVVVAVAISAWNPKPVLKPVTTVQFDCLIVDSDGVAVAAVLTVENEDVLTLITGDKWRFQRRMEEQ